MEYDNEYWILITYIVISEVWEVWCGVTGEMWNVKLK